MKKLFKLSAIILALMIVISSLASCSEPFEPGRGYTYYFKIVT